MDDPVRTYVKRLDHVAIAVHSIRDAMLLYRDLLGGEYHQGGNSGAGGFRWVQFAYPDGGKLELLEPLGEDSFLHDFLRKRGEGVHHITFFVEELEELVQYLKTRGLRIVGEDYRDPTWKEAFISPPSAHGTVVQLVESTLSDAEQVQVWHPDLETLLRGET